MKIRSQVEHIDNRPSIAELQEGARRRMGTTTLQDYEATGRDMIAAAPVLLEIVAAVLAVDEAEAVVVAERTRCLRSDDETRLDAAEAELSRCRAAHRAALGKVRR